MSKKGKKNKKTQLTKKEIEAMVLEVQTEAAKEAEAMSMVSEAEVQEPDSQSADPISDSAETLQHDVTAEVSPAAESAAEAPETEINGSEADNAVAEEPSAEESVSEETEAEESETEKPETEAENPVPEAEADAPETETEVSKPEEPAETMGINDSDAALPNADGAAEDPTGSKSVFLTVKEDGKLAIAVNKEGEIIYEDNVIPPKPTFFSRFKKFIIAAAAIALLVAGWFAYDYLVPKKITVVINSLENSRTMTESVTCTDVAGALDKMGIKLSEIDEVHPFLTRRAESGMKIEVTRHLESLANVDGKNKKIFLIPGTVEENLAFNEIEYDEDDIVSPLPTAAMTSSTKVVVKDVVVVVKEEQKTIASGSRVILDPSLSSGVYSATEAQDGTALYTYTTTYINGESTGTKEEFKEWVTKPQDDTIRLGTSVTGHSGEVVIKWSFTSNTTAYYMGENAYGASGGHCHYGTCAVDPSVIPYGSILWVSGYGFAVANDCGGAIVGTNLDLYMRTTEECYSWGRRYVTAYLLGWA